MILKKPIDALANFSIFVNSESGLQVLGLLFTKLYQNLAVGCTPLAFFLMTVLNLDPEE